MALTGYIVVVARTAGDLNTQCLALAASSYIPLGPPALDLVNQQFAQAMVIGDVAGGPGSGTDYTLPVAGVAIGGVKIAAAVEDSTVDDAADIADLVASFNELLAKLRTSGALTP